MAELPIIMPKMSMTMEEGTVVVWHKAPGDAIAKGEVVAEVLTDKVDMEVESPHEGVLSRIVADVDDVVPVGEPIGFIESDQDDLLGDLFASMSAEVEDSAEESADVETAPEASETAEDIAPETAEEAATERGIIAASPLARKLARDAGIDLASVSATGPQGTIRVPDVKAAIESAGSAPATAQAAPVAAVSPTTDTQEKAEAQATPAPAAVAEPAAAAAPVVSGELYGDSAFQRSRKAVTRSMQPSTNVPQFTAYRAIDLTAMDALRKSSLQGVSWTTIIVRALALAIREYPQLNSFWTDEGAIANADIGVTIAVDTEHGLMIPVLVNPDQKTLRNLNDELKFIVEEARERRMDLEALKKATTTVSNMGGLGVDRFNALITPPQATALSMGAIEQSPVWNEESGRFEPQLQIQIGLTMDHRVGDGADAARVLQHIQDLLNDPIGFLA